MNVIGIDNRDETTTTLQLSNGESIDVNPVELFTNMIENCFDPEDDDIDPSLIDDMIDFLKERRNGM